MSERQYKYRITAAFAQCGDKPPYNCLSIPVRMDGETPQIKINGDWTDCHKDKPRPALKRYFGLPVAGIATDWKLDE